MVDNIPVLPVMYTPDAYRSMLQLVFNNNNNNYFAGWHNIASVKLDAKCTTGYHRKNGDFVSYFPDLRGYDLIVSRAHTQTNYKWLVERVVTSENNPFRKFGVFENTFMNMIAPYLDD